MIEDPGKKYSIRKEDNILIFMTSSFTAEKGSVLHSGIYNREFTSLLASMAVAGGVYMILVLNSEKKVAYYIIIALVFAVGFPLLRKFVFRDRHMETVFNNTTGMTEIYLRGIRRRKKADFSIHNITDINVESRKTGIENPDGVAFVKKISLQHGMAIPGFGEETIFYMLKLRLSDGRDMMIYADSNKQDVISAQSEIKEFLKV